jgi:hypothetical protein
MERIAIEAYSELREQLRMLIADHFDERRFA